MSPPRKTHSVDRQMPHLTPCGRAVGNGKVALTAPAQQPTCAWCLRSGGLGRRGPRSSHSRATPMKKDRRKPEHRGFRQGERKSDRWGLCKECGAPTSFRCDRCNNWRCFGSSGLRAPDGRTPRRDARRSHRARQARPPSRHRGPVPVRLHTAVSAPRHPGIRPSSSTCGFPPGLFRSPRPPPRPRSASGECCRRFETHPA